VIAREGLRRGPRDALGRAAPKLSECFSPSIVRYLKDHARHTFPNLKRLNVHVLSSDRGLLRYSIVSRDLNADLRVTFVDAAADDAWRLVDASGREVGLR
jgi:hypothetical protein